MVYIQNVYTEYNIRGVCIYTIYDHLSILYLYSKINSNMINSSGLVVQVSLFRRIFQSVIRVSVSDTSKRIYFRRL